MRDIHIALTNDASATPLCIQSFCCSSQASPSAAPSLRPAMSPADALYGPLVSFTAPSPDPGEMSPNISEMEGQPSAQPVASPFSWLAPTDLSHPADTASAGEMAQSPQALDFASTPAQIEVPAAEGPHSSTPLPGPFSSPSAGALANNTSRIVSGANTNGADSTRVADSLPGSSGASPPALNDATKPANDRISAGHDGSNTAGIIAGVISGSCVAFLLVVFGCLWLVDRRKKRNNSADGDLEQGNVSVMPFDGGVKVLEKLW